MPPPVNHLPAYCALLGIDPDGVRGLQLMVDDTTAVLTITSVIVVPVGAGHHTVGTTTSYKVALERLPDWRDRPAKKA